MRTIGGNSTLLNVRALTTAAGVALAAFAGTAPVLAQSYPAKPIRLVVGFTPGGTNDVLARFIGPKVAEQVGQTVVVENRAGANGIVGTDYVAKAAPDGYTLLLHSVAHAINAGLYKKLPFDPVADLTPIVLLAAGQLVLVVHPSLPARNTKEFIALDRARPGALNYASSGSGGSPHLAMELLKTTARIDLVHVPYKGAAPALTDVISGQVPVMFPPLLPALPHINSGRLRALAIAGRERSPAAPQLPTMAEAALPAFEASAWFGIFGPAKLGRDITQRLNTEFNRALQAPDLRERLTAQGAEPLGGTPEQFAAYVRSEIEKWGRVIEMSGAKPE